MATKTFCDNCDNEIVYGRPKTNVDFETPRSNALAYSELGAMHELCDGCIRAIYAALEERRGKDDRA